MLIHEKAFKQLEKILNDKGVIPDFEANNGKITGRMMIIETDMPSDTCASGAGSCAFEGSFDFYDVSVGVVIDTFTKQVISSVWFNEQKRGAEHPSDVWVRFFLKTLMNGIDEDGGYGVPIYTFVNDHSDFTFYPTKDQPYKNN